MTKKIPKVIDSITDPDKAKLLLELLKGEPQEEQRYMFVIEQHKVSMLYGFVKFEVFSNEKTLFRFKIQQHISPRPDAPMPYPHLPAQQGFDWSKLEVGKKSYTAGFVDMESKSLWEKIKEGIDNCLEDGEIPFMPSGLLIK